MPRRNLKRPLPLTKWTDAERERGYRRWMDGTGREFVQSAPGRGFTIVHYAGVGTRVVTIDEAKRAPAGVRTLAEMFRALPQIGVTVSNDEETGWTVLYTFSGVAPSARVQRVNPDDVPDYGEFLSTAPEPRPPLVGPVSAEHVAWWVGFNAGRGERFLAEFVLSGRIRARLVPGRKRIWEFEEAALSLHFPGQDWAEMMQAYAEIKARPAGRGPGGTSASYQHHYTPKYALKRRDK